MKNLPPFAPTRALRFPQRGLYNAKIVDASISLSKIHAEAQYVRHRAMLPPDGGFFGSNFLFEVKASDFTNCCMHRGLLRV